jgi:hypothetical protein
VALQPVTEGADGNTRKFMKASTAEPGGHADVALEEVNFASEDDLAIFVEEPRPNGFAYRLANTKFVLTAGAEVQMSDRAAGEADRICELQPTAIAASLPHASLCELDSSWLATNSGNDGLAQAASRATMVCCQRVSREA